MKTLLKKTLPVLLLITAIGFIGSSCGGNDTPCTKQTYYMDADGDGYGTDEFTIEECEPKDGYVAQNGDCDDSNAAINPGATEICDGIDNNCDGTIDENLDCTTFYRDNDGDNFGDPNNTMVGSGTPPEGWLLWAGDCDDNNDLVNVLADEIMNNETDDNCDGDTDSGVRYIDADGDGYGSQNESAANGVFNNLDCDDTNAAIHPYQAEIVGNGIDDNCDGVTE